MIGRSANSFEFYKVTYEGSDLGDLTLTLQDDREYVGAVANLHRLEWNEMAVLDNGHVLIADTQAGAFRISIPLATIDF